MSQLTFISWVGVFSNIEGAGDLLAPSLGDTGGDDASTSEESVFW